MVSPSYSPAIAAWSSFLQEGPRRRDRSRLSVTKTFETCATGARLRARSAPRRFNACRTGRAWPKFFAALSQNMTGSWSLPPAIWAWHAATCALEKGFASGAAPGPATVSGAMLIDAGIDPLSAS